jgi:hypothetical protein
LGRGEGSGSWGKERDERRRRNRGGFWEGSYHAKLPLTPERKRARDEIGSKVGREPKEGKFAGISKGFAEAQCGPRQIRIFWGGVAGVYAEDA